MKVNSSTSNSKKITVIRLIIFICIVSILLILIGNHFEKISKKNQNLTYAKQALNNFYIDAREVELIFLGSSHSYCTFDPEYFDKHMGIYSYQLGTPLQHPDTSYYMLLEVLKGSNPKKPKRVVFEIYWDMIDDEFELKQADMFLEAIKNDKLKKQYIKDVFPLNEKIKYKFKPIRYQQDAFAYYNNKLTEFVNKYKIDRDPEQTYIEYYKERGFLYTEKIMPTEKLYATNQFRGMDGSNWNINRTQKSYIIKLAELCKANSIELYFVTAPIANKSMEYIKNYDSINKKITDLAKQLDVNYIDYNIVNQEEKMLSNDDFCDDAHLNYKGAIKVQEHFIQWLKNISIGGIKNES